MAVQSRRIKRQSRRVERALEASKLQEEKTRAVNRFLLDTLGQADPREGKGPNLTVVEALTDAGGRIDEYLREQPEIAAVVRETIGRTLSSLGRYDEAEALLRHALADQQRFYGGDHAEIAKTMSSLAGVLQDKTLYEQSETLGRGSLEMRRRLLGDWHLDTAQSLHDLGSIHFSRGDAEQALHS